MVWTGGRGCFELQPYTSMPEIPRALNPNSQKPYLNLNPKRPNPSTLILKPSKKGPQPRFAYMRQKLVRLKDQNGHGPQVGFEVAGGWEGGRGGGGGGGGGVCSA